MQRPGISSSRLERKVLSAEAFSCDILRCNNHHVLKPIFSGAIKLSKNILLLAFASRSEHLIHLLRVVLDSFSTFQAHRSMRTAISPLSNGTNTKQRSTASNLPCVRVRFLSFGDATVHFDVEIAPTSDLLSGPKWDAAFDVLTRSSFHRGEKKQIR